MHALAGMRANGRAFSELPRDSDLALEALETEALTSEHNQVHNNIIMHSPVRPHYHNIFLTDSPC